MQFIEIMYPKTHFIDGMEVASPRPNNDEAHALFARIVEETPGLHWWDADAMPQNNTKRLVVIAANWSAVDLRSMDELAAAAAKLEQKGVYVEIYSYDEIRSVEHLNTIIPNLGAPVNGPFVGVWKGDEQIACNHGLWARQLITEYITFSFR